MNKRHGFRTSAVLALLAVGVVITVACDGKKAGFPTQPAARDFVNPETSFVAADFSCSEVAGLTIAFENLSTGNVDTYFWNFGDRRTSRAKDPIHTYREFGDYIVVLTVTNQISSDSKARKCTVTDPEAVEEGL